MEKGEIKCIIVKWWNVIQQVNELYLHRSTVQVSTKWGGGTGSQSTIGIETYDFFPELYWDTIDTLCWVNVSCTSVDVIHLHVAEWFPPKPTAAWWLETARAWEYFGGWKIYLLPWLWGWLHRCTHMSELRKFHISHIHSLLCVNYTSIKSLNVSVVGHRRENQGWQ